MEYCKINTLFKRERKTKSKPIIPNEWSNPIFKMFEHFKFNATEKIDGENNRFIFTINEDGSVTKCHKGKKDKSNLFPMAEQYVKELFKDDEVLKAAFPNCIGTEITLFGEVYGKNINSCGKRYLKSENKFILFDVGINGMYLNFSDVKDIAMKLNIDVVPELEPMTIDEAINFVMQNPKSLISEDPNLISEGVVLRPEIELYDKKGDRIILKVKSADFRKYFASCKYSTIDQDGVYTVYNSLVEAKKQAKRYYKLKQIKLFGSEVTLKYDEYPIYEEIYYTKNDLDEKVELYKITSYNN